jgi:hypothetical protein
MNQKILSVKDLINHPIFLSLLENHPCLIPGDFDWKAYINNSTDLKNIYEFSTENEAKIHYVLFGKKEYRNYRQTINAKTHILDHNYKNMDPKVYKILNVDLSYFTDEQATVHFLNHGIKEKRKYKCDFSYRTIIEKTKTINLEKTDILLINHDTSLTGAPKALQNIYDFITEKKHKKILYSDVVPDKKIQIKNIAYHINDYHMIKKIIDKTKPSIILSNSLNIYTRYVHKFNDTLDKTIFYFHETYAGLKLFMPEQNLNILKKRKVYVVSEKIKEEFIQNGFENVFVSPPFVAKKELKRIDMLKLEPVEKIKNISNCRVLNAKKTIIGMCGTMCDRKNFTMFCEIARSLKNIEFLWIGGDISSVDEKYKKINNLFIVENTTNPYKYFELLDYFFLTSKCDPCPFVVLENLYMNKKVIVLDKNIHYEHDTSSLENYIILKNHDNSSKIITHKLKKLKLSKRRNKTSKNIDYIKLHFSHPKNIIDEIG